MTMKIKDVVAVSDFSPIFSQMTDKEKSELVLLKSDGCLFGHTMFMTQRAWDKMDNFKKKMTKKYTK